MKKSERAARRAKRAIRALRRLSLSFVPHESERIVRRDFWALSQQRSPVGGVTVQGEYYPGGQFIPGDVMERATAEERRAVEKRIEAEPLIEKRAEKNTAFLSSEHTLDKPIKGPTGAEIIGYEWVYRMEDTLHGERKVSAWEEHQISENTGRPIVHLYWVRHKDGHTQLLGVGAAQKALGIQTNRLYQVAKQEVAKREAKRQIADQNEHSIFKGAQEVTDPKKAIDRWKGANNAEKSHWGTYNERVKKFAELERNLKVLQKGGRFFATTNEELAEELKDRGWEDGRETEPEPKPEPPARSKLEQLRHEMETAVPDEFAALEALSARANRKGYRPDDITPKRIEALKQAGFVSGRQHFKLTRAGIWKLQEWKREKTKAENAFFDAQDEEDSKPDPKQPDGKLEQGMLFDLFSAQHARRRAKRTAYRLLSLSGGYIPAESDRIVFRDFQAQALALQPGVQKVINGRTYVLNRNHRWALPQDAEAEPAQRPRQQPEPQQRPARGQQPPPKRQPAAPQPDMPLEQWKAIAPTKKQQAFDKKWRQYIADAKLIDYVPDRPPSPQETAMAAQEGDSMEQRRARMVVSRHFLQTEGLYYDFGSKEMRPLDGPRVNGMLEGIDFGSPVITGPPPSVPPPEAMGQWQAPGGLRGGYFAPVGATPAELGLGELSVAWGIDGRPIKQRVPKTYRFPPAGIGASKLGYIRSTAAPIVDNWGVENFAQPAGGGGTQWFIPQAADPKVTIDEIPASASPGRTGNPDRRNAAATGR